MKNWSNMDYSFFIWQATTPKQANETRTFYEESVWLVRAGKKLRENELH